MMKLAVLLMASSLMIATPAFAQEPPMCWALELIPNGQDGAVPQFIFGYPSLTAAYAAKKILLGSGEDAYDENKRKLYEMSDQYKIDKQREDEELEKQRKAKPDGGPWAVNLRPMMTTTVSIKWPYANGRIFPAPCSSR